MGDKDLGEDLEEHWWAGTDEGVGDSGIHLDDWDRFQTNAFDDSSDSSGESPGGSSSSSGAPWPAVVMSTVAVQHGLGASIALQHEGVAGVPTVDGDGAATSLDDLLVPNLSPLGLPPDDTVTARGDGHRPGLNIIAAIADIAENMPTVHSGSVGARAGGSGAALGAAAAAPGAAAAAPGFARRPTPRTRRADASQIFMQYQQAGGQISCTSVVGLHGGRARHVAVGETVISLTPPLHP